MNNWNFFKEWNGTSTLQVITRFLEVSKQLRVSSVLFTLEITEAGSAVVSPVLLSSHRFHFILQFFVSNCREVVHYFTNRILLFFLFFPNQKVFYSNRRPFVERLPVAQIPKPRKIPSEERGHEQRTTHGRLARGFWRNSMTLHYYTKTIDVGRKSSSHLKWVHQWISFTRFWGFEPFCWPSNINKRLRHFLRENKVPSTFSGALTFLVKSTGYLSKSTSPRLSQSSHFIR